MKGKRKRDSSESGEIGDSMRGKWVWVRAGAGRGEEFERVNEVSERDEEDETEKKLRGDFGGRIDGGNVWISSRIFHLIPKHFL